MPQMPDNLDMIGLWKHVKRPDANDFITAIVEEIDIAGESNWMAADVEYVSWRHLDETLYYFLSAPFSRWIQDDEVLFANSSLF